MSGKLLIIGSGGHGKVCADVAESMNNWNEICFLDDNKQGKILNYSILGPVSTVSNYIEEYDCFVAIGDNQRRSQLLHDLICKNARVATLIHKNAILGSDIKVAMGSVLMAGVILNASTVIGKGCIINTATTVDHDSNIGDYVHISPGCSLAGNVEVGSGSWIGIGSVIINNISINSDCLVGAGAIVVNDLLVSGTYLGQPAKIKKPYR